MKLWLGCLLCEVTLHLCQSHQWIPAVSYVRATIITYLLLANVNEMVENTGVDATSSKNLKTILHSSYSAWKKCLFFNLDGKAMLSKNLKFLFRSFWDNISCLFQVLGNFWFDEISFILFVIVTSHSFLYI